MADYGSTISGDSTMSSSPIAQVYGSDDSTYSNGTQTYTNNGTTYSQPAYSDGSSSGGGSLLDDLGNGLTNIMGQPAFSSVLGTLGGMFGSGVGGAAGQAAGALGSSANPGTGTGLSSNTMLLMGGLGVGGLLLILMMK